MELSYLYHYSANFIAPDNDSKIFIRLEVDDPKALATISLKHYPVLFKTAPALPITRWHKDLIGHEYYEAALKLKERGFTKCVISANDDGFLHQFQSPRFNSANLTERMSPLLSIYLALQPLFSDLWVIALSEELCPAGLDASEGIAIAKKLESLGLKSIIAASGTRDFPALYDRRSTQKKASQVDDFYSNEPSLASALWFKQHTKLAVWSLSTIDHESTAQKLAEQLQLAGLVIDKNRNK